MGTTKNEIRGWLESAKAEGATHLLVATDTWDYEDYPVPVMPGENVRDKFNEYSSNMNRVMEVYNLGMDLEEQLREYRAFNF